MSNRIRRYLAGIFLVTLKFVFQSYQGSVVDVFTNCFQFTTRTVYHSIIYRFLISSSEEKLHFGVILCSLGVRYKFYCSNIVRTLMVEPTQEQQDVYTFLISLLDLVIDKLRHGKISIGSKIFKMMGVKFSELFD